ncbi:type II toxin-antitoxin system RelE/ParE family toxin [Geofilum sp. OHC36d9]|uniref:type II toxin-antitoxin system RelE/ParE family toxin n=1 Tax=Geofilum sp. OHC36d9 TaxID=3458413 RepID=UPI0040340944
MDLRIFWTDTAKYQLEDIFDYYKSKVSIKTAKKIVGKIVDKTLTLKKNPTIGQKEELLTERKNEYRYLVEGNYKIIYWIEDNYAKISAVFDCRQNPVKMKEL